MFVFVSVMLNLFAYFLVDKGFYPLNAIVICAFLFKTYLVIFE
jgi:hypothetical protein